MASVIAPEAVLDLLTALRESAETRRQRNRRRVRRGLVFAATAIALGLLIVNVLLWTSTAVPV
ncbi:MAG TPA: hypothetical protein VJ986_09495 [Gaiellaceae bacterium]|nr:hypothetical protein [Gaiellaceae bacterium]